MKERKIGDAKVMTFDDIMEARKMWERAETEREKRSGQRRRGSRPRRE